MAVDLGARASNHPTVSAYSADVKKDFNYGLEKFLDHPGIVSVLNFFEANKTGYLVMEL